MVVGAGQVLLKQPGGFDGPEKTRLLASGRHGECFEGTFRSCLSATAGVFPSQVVRSCGGNSLAILVSCAARKWLVRLCCPQRLGCRTAWLGLLGMCDLSTIVGAVVDPVDVVSSRFLS